MPVDRLPDWLSEACPPWCAGEHEGQDLPADRQHQSAQDWLPAVVLARRRTETGAVVRSAEATELCVVAMRYVGEREAWVTVATETEQLELSVESAQRLHTALGGVLAQMP